MRTPMRHTSDALRRLRTGITIACWAVIVGLAVQMVTWALVNFTGLRHGQMSVVIPEPSAIDSTVGAALSSYDSWFQVQNQFAMGLGYIGLGVLLLQISLGIVVASATNSTGSGRITIAQSWTVVLMALALPWGAVVDHFPYRGMFTPYNTMCAHVDAFLAETGSAPGPVMFYGQYFFLPLMGIIGVIYVWTQFRSGSEAEILPYGLNPEDIAVEREAAGRKAGSLHGSGRTGGALHQLVSGPASGKRNMEQSPLQNVPKAPKPEPPSSPLQIDTDDAAEQPPARRAI